MKKRLIALVLVVTLVWGTIGDFLPLGRSVVLANELPVVTPTDLDPADSQDTNPPSEPPAEPETGTDPESPADGEEEAEGEEQPRVMLMSAAPARTLGAGNPSGSSGSPAQKTLLESMVMDKINELFSAQGILNQRIQVMLNANTIYEGDSKLTAGTMNVGEAFELELTAEDAGISGTEGSGQTVIDGNLIILGIKVIMNSIMMGNDKKITVKNAEDAGSDNSGRGGELIYNGTEELATSLTATVGKNSSLTVVTGGTNDKISVETSQDAKSVTIDAGDGLNNVSANITGGDLNLVTGDSSDTVSVQVHGEVGQVRVNTGAGMDDVYFLDNGRAKTELQEVEVTDEDGETRTELTGGILVETGAGDDSIELDLRANAGSMTLDTGLGGDTVNMRKGDFNIGESLDYSRYYAPYEQVSGNSTAVITLKNSDPQIAVDGVITHYGAVNRYTIDVAVSRAVKAVQMTGGKGASVYLRGVLKADMANGANPIEEIREDGTRTGIKVHTTFQNQGLGENNDYTLEITAEDGLENYNFTDALTNKKRVEIYAAETGGFTYSTEKYGQLQEFTDYVFKTPVSDLETIDFSGVSGELDGPLMLTNVVLDGAETKEAYDGYTNVNDVNAPNMNVLVKNRIINIKGEIKAQNFRAESAQASKAFLEPEITYFTGGEMSNTSDKFAGLGGLANDELNIVEYAVINVEKGADIETEKDIDLVARVKMMGGMLAIASTVNAVMAKYGYAVVDIEEGAALTARKGSVSALAKMETTTGEIFTGIEQESGEYQSIFYNDSAFPISIHGQMLSAEVDVAHGATISAAEDVLLNSKVGVKDYSYSNAWTSFAASATVLLTDVSTTVEGKVTAGRNVALNAEGFILDDTASRNAEATKNGATNLYFAVNFVNQDVKALIKKGAEVTATYGDVKVNSFAITDIKTHAIAGKVKESSMKNLSERIDAGALVMTFLTKVLPVIIFPPVSVPAYVAYKKWYDTPARAAKKLEELRKKLSIGDYEVRITNLNDENARMGSATVSVKLRKLNSDVVDIANQAAGDKEQEGYLVGVITPAPNAGYRVQKVMYRYLIPGNDKYEYGEAVRDENAGLWYFPLPVENNKIAKKSFEAFVIFEEDPDAGQQEQQQEQQQPAAQEEHEHDYLYEDGYDINNMILDGEEAAEGNADDDAGNAIEAQAPQQEEGQQGVQQEGEARRHSLVIWQYTVPANDHDNPDKNSKLLTWQVKIVRENNKTTYENLSTIHSGQQIRFVGNTNADRQLDLVTISYYTDLEEHTNETRREVRIARNSVGQFVFTVPDDAPEGTIFNATPTFGPAVDNRAEEADQFTGAFAAAIVLNKSTAAIQPGNAGKNSDGTNPDITKVIAGGSVDLLGVQTTEVDTLADGSAITETLPSLGEDQDRVIDYTLSKWTVPGAQNVIKADSSIAGTITTTMENDQGASTTHPKITFTPAENAPAYQQIRIRIAYYTKLNANIFNGTMLVRDYVLTPEDLAELESEGTLERNLPTEGWNEYLEGLAQDLSSATLKISKGENGEFVILANMGNLAIMNGTTAEFSLMFLDEAGDVITSGEGAVAYNVRNPISINVNAKAETWKRHVITNDNITEFGQVTFVAIDPDKPSRYYFNYLPNDGYVLLADAEAAEGGDSQMVPGTNTRKSNTKALYACWTAADGTTRKTALKRTTGNSVWDAYGAYWYIDLEDGNLGIPEGTVVRICGIFTEDLKDVVDTRTQQQIEAQGKMKIGKAQAKPGDQVEIQLEAAEGKGAYRVTLSYDHGTIKDGEQTVFFADENGKVKIIVPKYSDSSYADVTKLIITPEFMPRDIEIKPAMSQGPQEDHTAGSIKLSIEDGKAFAGQVIRVTPSDDLVKKGYKVTEVHLADANGAALAGDQAIITGDVFNASADTRQVGAVLALKSFRVDPYEQAERGKLECATAYVDNAEQAVINVIPQAGYKAKTGTVKAIVKYRDGSSETKITAVWFAANKYRFIVPDGDIDHIELVCAFEKGKDEGSSSTGLAVALTYANAKNTVEIVSADVKAGNGISMISSNANGQFTTQAYAGFNSADSGKAGAFAIQYASTAADAAIRNKTADGKDKYYPETVINVGDGELFLLASQIHSLEVTGDASGKKNAEAKKSGVGGGVAFAIDSLSARSRVEKGVILDLGDRDDIASLTINSTQKIKDKVAASAGAAGGTSWVPALAVDVYQGTVLAKLDELTLKKNNATLPAGTELKVAGKAEVTAKGSASKVQYTHEVTADASARGDDKAMGGALTGTWIVNKVDALLKQSLDAGDIEVSAFSAEALKAVATAAVSGGDKGKQKDKKGSADRQADHAMNGAADAAGQHGGINGGEIRNDVQGRQLAETAESSVGGAGSFALSMMKNYSRAIASPDLLKASGKIAVTSKNRTEAFIRANSSTTKTDKGVGVGVALSIVKMENIARIGTGRVEAGELVVSATIAEAPTFARRVQNAVGESEFKKRIEEDIKEWLMGYLGDGTFGNIASQLVASTASAVADKLIDELNLRPLFAATGSSTGEMFENAAKLMADRLKAFPATLAAPFVIIVQQTMGMIDGWDDDKTQRLVDDVVNTLIVQVPGTFATSARSFIQENMWTLTNNVMDIIDGGINGRGWADNIKRLGSELLASLKQIAVKGFEDAIEESVTKMSAELPMLTDNNVALVKKAISNLKEKSTAELTKSFFPYVTQTFREQVYDYQPLMDKIQQQGLWDFIKEEGRTLLKEASIGLTNEAIDMIVGNLDVQFSPEPIADRHVFTTQAIAGAGSKDGGGAGSLAIAVLNLTTRAEILGSRNDVIVTDNVDITAEEIRRIRTHATAATDARGEPDNNQGVGTAASAEVGGGNSQNRTMHSADEKVEMTLTNGVDITFDRQDQQIKRNTKIFIELVEGYRFLAKNNQRVTRAITDADGFEREDSIELQWDESTDKFYVKPAEGLTAEQLESSSIHLWIEAEEDLQKIPKAKVGSYGAQNGEDIGKKYLQEDGNIEVRVVGREKDEDGDARGIYNDLVEIKVRKVKGFEVAYIYAEDHEGEGMKCLYAASDEIRNNIPGNDNANVNGVIRKASSDKYEEVYTFNVSRYLVKNIKVVFKKADPDAQQQRQPEQDRAGRTVGVGLSFSWTWGNSEVVAQIGSRAADNDGKEAAREGAVQAKTISVTASSEHEEENFSTAGTDPLEGTSWDQEGSNTAAKDSSWDFSVAFNMLDNDIYAGIVSKNKVKTVMPAGQEGDAGTVIGTISKKADDKGEDQPDDIEQTVGSLIISATEIARNEIRASAFAVGNSTAVGASAAVNVGFSDVEAQLTGGAETADKATIRAHSLNRDRTWAFASAMGADIQRSLNKFAGYTESGENIINGLADGTILDKKAGNEKEKKNSNDSSKKMTNRLNNDRVRQQDGDAAAENLPVSQNVQRVQGVRAENGAEAQNAAGADGGAVNEAAGEAGQDVGAEDGGNQPKRLQLAAAVGFSISNHTAAVKVGGNVKTAAGDIELTAKNAGNFNSRSTGLAMTREKGNGGNIVALAIGISSNRNKALIDASGSLNAAEGEGSVTVNADLKQNQTDDYKAWLAVQSISGSMSGTDTAKSISGAVSLLFTKSEVRAVLKSPEIKGDKVTIRANDKSRLSVRAGGINYSKGAATGMGISAASISSQNKVRAEIGSGATITAGEFSMSAAKEKITADDWEWPIKASQFITDSSELTDEQRENVTTGLIDVHKNPGDRSYKVDININSYKLMGFLDNLNYFSAQNYYAESIAGSVVTGRAEAGQQNGLNLGGSFSIVRMKNTVDTILGNNVTIQGRTETETLAAKPLDSVSISATGDTTARLFGGALSAGKAKSATGITVTFMNDSDTVGISGGDSLTILAAGKVEQKASGDTRILAVNAAAAVSTDQDASKARGGGINMFLMGNAVTNSIGSGATIKGSAVDISAKADNDFMAFSVSAMGAKNGLAAGGTIMVVDDATKSEVKIGDDHRIEATAGDITISAKSVDKILSLAASASAAIGGEDKKGNAFAGSLNVVRSKTTGKAELGAGGEGKGLFATAGSVTVTGDTDSRVANATLGAAYGADTAIGLSLNGNLFSRSAGVKITGGDGYAINAGKNVVTSAYGNDTSVMVSAAFSAGKKTTASGNLSVLFSSNTVKNEIVNAAITAGGEAAFTSRLRDHTVAVNGNLSVQIDMEHVGEGTSVGAGGMLVKKANTVKTDLGTSTATANGSGGALYTLLKKAKRVDTIKGDDGKEKGFSGIYAGATGDDSVTAIAAGIAVGTGGKGVTFNALTSINNNSIEANASHAELASTKADVTVRAKGHSSHLTITGGLNASMGTSVGPGILALHSAKQVKAMGHVLHADRDVNVIADNRDGVTEVNVNVGGGEKYAVQVGINYQNLKNKVTAVVASDVKATKGGFNLKAFNTSDIDNVNVAVAGALKNAAAAPVVTLTNYTGETNALLGTGTVNAAKDVSIVADSSKEIDQYTIGAAASRKMAASGAFSLMFLKDHTNAIVQHGTTITGKNLNVDAKSNYSTTAGSAAVAIAIGGGENETGAKGAYSANVIFNSVKGSVLAEMEGSANLTGKANINATSDRDLDNYIVSLTGSLANAGVGVTVMVTVAGTQMSDTAANMIAYGSAKKGSEDDKTFDMDALIKKMEELGVDTSDMKETSGKDEAGNEHNNSSASYDLQGNGQEDGNVKTSQSGAFDGTSGVINHSAFSSDENAGKGKDNVGETADIKNAKGVGTTVYDDSFPDAVVARIGKDAKISATGVNVVAAQDTTADLFGLNFVGAASSTNKQPAVGVSFTMALLRSNVIASSVGTIENLNGGEMNVLATSTSGKAIAKMSDEDRNAALAGSFEKAAESEGSAIRAVGIAASISTQDAFAAAGGGVRVDNISRATLGGTVENAGAVNVHASTLYEKVLAVSIAAAGGLNAAVAASVGIAIANGDVDARIDKTAKIHGTDTAVTLTTKSDFHAITAAATAAVATGKPKSLTEIVSGAGTAAVAVALNSLTQNTVIEKGAEIDLTGSNGTLSVRSESETGASSYLVGFTASTGLSFGIGFALSNVKPTLNTSIGTEGDGEQVTLKNLKSVEVLNDATSTGESLLVSVVLGVNAGIALNAELVFNDTQSTAKVANVGGEIGSMRINSDLKAKGDALIVAAQVSGGASVGLSVGYVDVNSTNRAELDTDHFDAKVNGDLTVSANDFKEDSHSNTTSAKAKTYATAIGYRAAVGLNGAVALNRAKNEAIIKGARGIEANTVNLNAYGKAKTETDIWGISVGEGAIGASVSFSRNEGTSLAQMKIGGALGANLNANSGMIGDTDAKLHTGGGSIAGLRVNVANAKGKTQSIVDVSSAAASEKTIAVSAKSRGSNDVYTSIDNLAIDILLSIGIMTGYATSEDVYTTNISLKNGDYKLSSLNANTIGSTKVKSVVTPSSGGVNAAGIRIGFNEAEAVSRAYFGSELEISNGTVDASGDIDVTATGDSKVDSAIETTMYFGLDVIKIAGSYSTAELKTSQAAVLRLNEGSVTNANKINIESITDNAQTGAAIGSSGTDKSGKGGVRLELVQLVIDNAEAYEDLSSTAIVIGSGKAKNKITAKTLNVKAAMGETAIRDKNGKITGYEIMTTKAESVTRNGYEGSIISITGLDSKAFTSDSFNSEITGVDAQISGAATVVARSNSVSRAEGTAPGAVKVIEASWSKMKAGNGTRENQQTAKVLIGDDTVLKTGGNLILNAENKGYSETDFVKKTYFSVASVKFSEVPTESYYDTGIIIGTNVELEAEGTGDLRMRSDSRGAAKSTINAFALALAFDYSQMKGKNTINDRNIISVGEGTNLTTDEGMIDIMATTSTAATAKTELKGAGVLGDCKFAEAKNIINRQTYIDFERDNELQSTRGSIRIVSASGDADNIVADTFVKSGGLLSWCSAKSYNDVDSDVRIIIGEDSDVLANQNIYFLARATSILAKGEKNDTREDLPEDDIEVPLDEDSMTEEEKKAAAEQKELERSGERRKIKKASDDAQKESGQYPETNTPNRLDNPFADEGYGILVKAVASSFGGYVDPDAKAVNTLVFTAVIQFNMNTSRRAERSSIKSTFDSILMEVNNDGMRVKSDAYAKGGPAFGSADAWSEIDVSLRNTIWVDEADISSMKGTTLLPHNSSAAGLEPYFHLVSDASMKGLGGSHADGIITGQAWNQIRTYAKDDVDVRGPFIHIVRDPRDSIIYTIKIKNFSESGTGSGADGESFAWGAAKRRCDFCESGQSAFVNDLSYDWQKLRRDSFAKALVPLEDIRKKQASLEINKARYGEEDYTAASSIYALDASTILTKDVALEGKDLDAYRLWTNTRTGYGVYLLPNSTRMHYGAGNQLQYVSEIMHGDVLGDGEIRDVEIITALTRYAFGIPVIPIGSTGQLDFTTGTLTLPSLADFELFLDEVSGAWLKEKLDAGFIRRLDADQDAINDTAINGAALQPGTIVEGITAGEEKDGWQIWWLGATPETAEDPDQTLLFIMVNGETDEVDAFRTSVNMIENGEDPVDVSLYLYRDSDSDRMSVEKYNCLFFDTPEGEKSIVKVVTDGLTNRELEVPRPLEIVMRGFELEGADLTGYAVSGMFFAMNDGTDGSAEMFFGAYTATFDGDIFDSPYMVISGIRTGDITVTMKEGQPVWLELTGEDTAKDAEGNEYVLVDGVWYLSGEEPVSANAESGDGTL